MECVVGIGKNLFYNSPMEACIVICRMNKKQANRGKVLFINAMNEVERKNAQSYLRDEHIKHIAEAYEKYEDEEGFACVATISDIEENDFSLSIPLYVKGTGNSDSVKDERSLQEVYEAWEESSANMHESYSALNKLL